MFEADRIKYLRIALLLVGVTFIVGIYTLTIIWPSGWSWHTGPVPHYLQIILGVYATLGVFLLVASRNKAPLLQNEKRETVIIHNEAL